MPHPSTFVNPLKKTSPRAYTAPVFNHTGKKHFEGFPETGYFIGRPLLKLFEVKLHLNELIAADTPVIGTFEDFNFDDAHIGWFNFFWITKGEN
jgi:hypothetical protein